MIFSPLSFLLGLGAAWLVPTLARVARPLAVEATAVGMAVFEDARRVVAEQMEAFEDIVAEARARGAAADANGDAPDEAADTRAEEPEEAGDDRTEDAVTQLRPRRRTARRESPIAKP